MAVNAPEAGFAHLPADLPVPVDDGAADHLLGMTMPTVLLQATLGRAVRLDSLGDGLTVIYGYPMTGVPGVALPGGWDEIPGARGCTPQACAFRDLYSELQHAGAAIYGLSTQPPAYQKELADRLHLPFPILSDSEFSLCDRLTLPTMEVHGTRLLKRITLFVRAGRVVHVIYPVFPSNQSAQQALDWLRTQS